ncbi:hypothetical protein B0H10DRAFT_2191856 [Mycena sp. CBHHK59/15]|nr:hypothetical protein B0H10DRAFT_2191856 [Mycena sp. CBHHK59/15]
MSLNLSFKSGACLRVPILGRKIRRGPRPSYAIHERSSMHPFNSSFGPVQTCTNSHRLGSMISETKRQKNKSPGYEVQIGRACEKMEGLCARCVIQSARNFRAEVYTGDAADRNKWSTELIVRTAYENGELRWQRSVRGDRRYERNTRRRIWNVHEAGSIAAEGAEEGGEITGGRLRNAIAQGASNSDSPSSKAIQSGIISFQGDTVVGPVGEISPDRSSDAAKGFRQMTGTHEARQIDALGCDDRELLFPTAAN